MKAPQAPYSMQSLLDIMQSLRDPSEGCPWDQQQDWQSIVHHTIEETYEVAEAIELALESKNFSEVKLELGDLLFQIVYYAQFAKEQGDFVFDDVIAGICEKLIRRHPHVFGEQQFENEAQIHENWEAEKQRERTAKGITSNSALDNIPTTMPAQLLAQKTGKAAAKVGFDWESSQGVVEKLQEELDELKLALAENDAKACQEELGDLMLSCVSMARHLKVDADQTLRQATLKFAKRFRSVEALAFEQQQQLEQLDPEQLDALWRKVKESY
ncbi:nucleoside triphosphate pyrophosphohydrolase [Alginatibacterium sediminis]|uniref:Nucleoside triphosphate pyrophosphohydrolase n=1 Tax=Alginatibacterium sediminis TaxID=2164068 RepID=A0A420ED84_9ALTE|nr:nucleoside triphosphate pyrophosphohydrolase [Alginatibacterium sediminis]RKF18614.1 nucleoside triphosphate pyrophosphohydrolase [Alginatibacterium sediminis]